jgi:hypothetical protein
MQAGTDSCCLTSVATDAAARLSSAMSIQVHAFIGLADPVRL